MANIEVMYSSKTDLWETPQWLFDQLNKEFGFGVDVCATVENRKCQYFFDKELDGLSRHWTFDEPCWMNPPYGREIGKWVKKAYEESQKGAVVVALLPARTDTRWFHDYIYGKAEIRFLKGRLRFGEATENAPFPNMVVIFKQN